MAEKREAQVLVVLFEIKAKISNHLCKLEIFSASCESFQRLLRVNSSKLIFNFIEK